MTKRKLIDLIERVGLRACHMRTCPKCGEIGLEVTEPETGTSYFIHTTDYKKVCTVVPKLAARAA